MSILWAGAFIFYTRYGCHAKFANLLICSIVCSAILRLRCFDTYNVRCYLSFSHHTIPVPFHFEYFEITSWLWCYIMEMPLIQCNYFLINYAMYIHMIFSDQSSILSQKQGDFWQQQKIRSIWQSLLYIQIENSSKVSSNHKSNQMFTFE